MRSRHAAALMLVSWYLMLPPALRDDPDKADASVPLSQWEVMTTYESRSQCADEQTRMIGLGNKLGRLSQCIASDDPRLKQKAPAN